MKAEQTAKANAPKPKALFHYGKTIILTAEGAKNEIVPFQHTFQDGSTETVGLRFNKPYKVGERDENGKIIKDWVYENYLTSDYNANRKMSSAELRAEENGQGGDVCDISL